MTAEPRARRPGARTATGIALAATMLTTAGVAAQSPSTAPDVATTPTQTTERSQAGGGRRGSDRSGPDWRNGGPGHEGRGSGGRGFAGVGLPGDRQGRSVTVASIDGSSLGLQTADGWTRTIDTTGVALTRDGVAIAITDILVGEPVRVVQTRNADGTYTVTGIEVQPTVVVGTVGTASADSFTIVGEDGTITTVTVTPQTTWSAGRGTTASITDATAGRTVAVQGQLQSDGSIIATRVRLG